MDGAGRNGLRGGTDVGDGVNQMEGDGLWTNETVKGDGRERGGEKR